MGDRVLMVWDIYDGPNAGITMYDGLPYLFKRIFDQTLDKHADHYRLYPITSEFLEIAQKQWKIFRNWEYQFHSGQASIATHPGHGNVNKDYDELESWLRCAIDKLEPTNVRFTVSFEDLPEQDHLPLGMLRDLGATWIQLN